MALCPCFPLELDQQIWRGAALHARLTGSARPTASGTWLLGQNAVEKYK